MYVCVCLAVTESEVRAAIEAGATTREVVTSHCGAGGDCGACHAMIEDMIEDHLEAQGGAQSGPALSGEHLVPTERLLRNPRAA